MTHEEAKAILAATGLNAAIKEDLTKVQPILEATPALIEAMNALVPKSGEETPQRLAARMRKLEIVMYFLSHGVKMELFMATAIGDVGFVEAHLDANPKDFDAKGANGVQLMVHANTAPMVDLLLKRGADATLALQQLAWQGRVELLKVALAAGGQVNMPVEGRRPLHIAAAMGHMEAVKLLLGAGADIHIRSKGADWERKNSLALALMGEHAEVAAYLRAEMAKTPAPPPVRPKGPFGTGPRRFGRF